jgi:5-methyltetrahydropteroyltriglutamate--homocysteine methyltransferase
MKQHAGGPFKVTLPNAAHYLSTGFQPGLTDQFYPTRMDLALELGDITNRELRALIADGVPYIQLDAPRYTFFIDQEQREYLEELGFDPDVLLDEAIAADNRSLAGLDRGNVFIGMHLCRGNSRGRYYAAGSYDAIAEKLFTQLGVDGFMLEYDSERAGGFEPLRFVPADKTVVLGLVTTKSPEPEQENDLLRKIDQASKYVAHDSLTISPQCGFASNAEGHPLTLDDQRRKLELVVNTARKAWG